MHLCQSRLLQKVSSLQCNFAPIVVEVCAMSSTFQRGSRIVFCKGSSKCPRIFSKIEDRVCTVFICSYIIVLCSISTCCSFQNQCFCFHTRTHVFKPDPQAEKFQQAEFQIFSDQILKQSTASFLEARCKDYNIKGSNRIFGQNPNLRMNICKSIFRKPSKIRSFFQMEIRYDLVTIVHVFSCKTDRRSSADRHQTHNKVRECRTSAAAAASRQ